MRYRKFGKLGIEVSALGFGCMRFPVVKTVDGDKIDEKRTIQMLRCAIDSGVNYLDTAYVYHDGESEVVLGKALQDGYREKVYIADKCAVWLLDKEEDFERMLDEQLRRLQVESIDFYLLHALDKERFEDKVKKFHLLAHMEKAKADGKIKHIGFSFHDSEEVLREIIDFYDGWEFCQIQYNYVDIHEQAGTEGLRYAAEKGLGVVVMEPLRGGKLADVAPHLSDAFPRDKKPVEWALDFLWDQPEVSLLLSGMSTEQQVEDNLIYAGRSSEHMLKEEERAMYGEAKRIFDTMAMVKCTKCAYCMPCPSKIDIPGVFAVYNSTATEGKERAKKVFDALPVKPEACVKCLRCEHACPQHIGVSAVMMDITEMLG